MIKNIYNRLRNALYRANRQSRHDDIDESVSRALMRLVARPPKIDPDSESFFAYAFVTAKNMYLRLIRDRKRYVSLDAVRDLQADDEAENFDSSDQLLTMLSFLPQIEREVIERSVFDEQSYQQIAEELNMSERAVEYRLLKAKEILRKLYSKESPPQQ